MLLILDQPQPSLDNLRNKAMKMKIENSLKNSYNS